MAEEPVQQDAPEEQGQETPEEQAAREEAEGKLDAEGNVKGEEGGDESDTENQDSQEENTHKKRVQKRIDELTKKRHEAERRAQELAEENRKLKEQQSGQPPADDPRPDFDEYDSVESWQRDYDAWARRQAKREMETSTEEPKTDPNESEAMDKVENAVVEASDRYPDFDEVVRDPSLPITGEMVQAIADTENIAEVLYHLGKNPQEAGRLAQLQGNSLIREVGRLEAKLENGPQSQQKATSAPEPISPTKGARTRREPKDDELSTEEWMKREFERMQQRG